MRRAVEQFRWSRSVVIFWAHGHLLSFNWRCQQRAVLPQDCAAFLGRCTEWTAFSDLCEQHGGEAAAVALSGLLDSLLRLGVMESSEAPELASQWDAWHPEASLFHFATKDQRFDADPFARDRLLREKARGEPQPEATKTTLGPSLALPVPSSTSLDDTLHSRRTWRRFGRAAVSLEDLSTILDRTFRVQAWAAVEGQGIVALKTSPSAGARTPIEAYVLALKVENLSPGAYHYDAARHTLVTVSRDLAPEDVVELLAHQHFYRGAAAIVVMTAVFERVFWRYPFGRAYRMVLLDAGHLGQTFCMAATALSLAPFCTMAFAEKKLEQLLAIDGVSECPMYVVGVGAPPDDDRRNPGVHADRADGVAESS